MGTRLISGSEAIRLRKVTIAFFGVEHAFIHIDINDLRAILNLISSYVQRRVVVVFQNQAFEFGRARDVTAFADIDE